MRKSTFYIIPSLLMSSVFMSACLPEDIPLTGPSDLQGTWLLQSDEVIGGIERVAGHDYFSNISSDEDKDMLEQQLVSMETAYAISGTYREVCQITKVSNLKFQTSCFPYLQHEQFMTGIAYDGQKGIGAPEALTRKVTDMTWDGKSLNSKGRRFTLYYEGDQLKAATSMIEVEDVEENIPMNNRIAIDNIHLTKLSTNKVNVIDSDIVESGINGKDSYSHFVELDLTIDVNFNSFFGMMPRGGIEQGAADSSLSVGMHSFYAYVPNQSKPSMSIIEGDHVLFETSSNDCEGESSECMSSFSFSMSVASQVAFINSSLESVDSGLASNFVPSSIHLIENPDQSITISIEDLVHGIQVNFNGIDTKTELSSEDFPENDEGDTFTGSLIVDYSNFLN